MAICISPLFRRQVPDDDEAPGGDQVQRQFIDRAACLSTTSFNTENINEQNDNRQEAMTHRAPNITTAHPASGH